MARLPFRTAFLFGSTAGADSVSVFGSLAAGSPAFSNPPDPANTQSLPEWEGGWPAAVQGNNQPAIEDVMAKEYTDSYFINYLQQIGIVEWDSSGDTPYDRYSIVNGALTTSDYQVYISAQNGNDQPLSNTNAWKKFGDVIAGKATILASVVFDGTQSGPTLPLLEAFNVTSVTKVGTGQYLVNFSISLPNDGSGNGIYGLSGSCGTQNGATPVGGDNNIVCGSIPGSGAAVRTPTQCQIFTWDSNVGGSGQLEDSGMISVNFWG